MLEYTKKYILLKSQWGVFPAAGTLGGIMPVQFLGSAAFPAMNAFSTGMQAIAHNIANVSTAGFEPLSARYATGADGKGMAVGSVRGAEQFPVAGQEGDSSSLTAMGGLPPEVFAPSGTDVAREFATMISTEHAFAANAATGRVWDEMLGAVLDTKA